MTAEKYKVFISYSHADDAVTSGKFGWVENLFNDLNITLNRRLVRSERQPEEKLIFFDSAKTRANSKLSDLTRIASEARTFLAIVSPSIIGADWPARELEAFLASGEDAASRVFAIETEDMHRLLLRADPPLNPVLSSAIRRRFFRLKDERTYRLAPRSSAWNARIEDLTGDLLKMLSPLHGESARALPTPKPAPKPPFVLLGQVTDDLDEERESLRRYLEQYGVPVLPTIGWPQGGEDFQRAFAADISKAAIHVQLLSPLPGRRPPDLPKGYIRYQFDLARSEAEKRGLRLLCWRQPDARPAPEDIAAMLHAPEVRATGFEAFKADVLDAWRNAVKPPKTAPVSNDRLLFVNAVVGDMHLADLIVSECKRRRIVCHLPLWQGAPDEVDADLTEVLTDCGAVVLVWGEATPTWLRGHHRKAHKFMPLSRHDRIALCDGPPPEKAPHNIFDPALRILDWRKGPDLAALGRLLDELFP